MTTKRIKNWWLLLIKGIILIGLSFLIFKHTEKSIMTVSLFLGGGLIIMGITLLIISLELKKILENWTSRLAEGIMDIVFGFFLLIHPGLTAAVIPIFIGFWIIFYGVLMLTSALQFPEERKIEKKGVMIFALVTLILGLIVSFNPRLGNMTVGILIGVPVLIIGIANIFFAFSLRSTETE
jgi:uncharacterized membrane protein HdeD (DUF308 family)